MEPDEIVGGRSKLVLFLGSLVLVFLEGSWFLGLGWFYFWAVQFYILGWRKQSAEDWGQYKTHLSDPRLFSESELYW